MSLSERLAEHVRACFTGLWVESHEHDEVLAEMAQLCRQECWRMSDAPATDGQTQTNSQTHTNGQAQATGQVRRSRVRKAGRQASAGPIDQAIALRDALRESVNKTKELIRTLKRQRQQSRLVQSTLASLKQLQQAG